MYASQWVIVEAWRLLDRPVFENIYWAIPFHYNPDGTIYSDKAWWIFKLGSDQFLFVLMSAMMLWLCWKEDIKKVVCLAQFTFWSLNFISWCLFFNEKRVYFWVVMVPALTLEFYYWGRRFYKLKNKK